MIMRKQKTNIFASKTFNLIALTAVLCVIIYLINPSFIAGGNIRGILITLCVQGTLLACTAILLISGNIDLSAGGLAALGQLFFAEVLVSYPSIPWPVALIMALIFGALLGLFNVFFMNVVRLMPFIVTIGTTSIFGGIATVITRGANVQIMNQSFNNIGKAAIFNVVPVLFIVMLVIVLIHGIILSSTRFGRNIYLIGGNPYAARLAGLNPERIRMILYVNSGVVSTIAGVIWAAQKKMSAPSNFISANLSMMALTAVILGGISFMGGGGGMTGAFAGMLLLNLFTFGLSILSIPSWVNIVIQGMLLIVALILDNINTMRMHKNLLSASAKKSENKKVRA